jgi:coniferyl-aldehyde dehydrogenase
MDISASTEASFSAVQFKSMRAAFSVDPYPSYDLRLDRLKRLEAALDKHADALVIAMSEDFGFRSAVESENFDIIVSLGGIRAIMRQFKRWTYDRKVSVPKHLLPASAKIVPQPLGVIGIISPWNFPINLSLMPMAAALAAGNRVMLKPSETTPKTSQILKDMLSEAFSADEVTVVLGGADVASEFSSLPFDHLLFTGSTKVGQRVYEAAAKNLTPVTLELGGKSPAIVAPSADIQRAARRIAWGKLANAGQICIAPDYALVEKSKLPEFIDALKDQALRFYGTSSGGHDFTSIISDSQFERLTALLNEVKSTSAEVVELPVAISTAKLRQFKPHVVINPPAHIGLMTEEIFGPILPIITYERIEDVIEHVKRGDHPLALYVFAEDKAEQDIWLRQTLAGGVCINDTLMHVACDSLPFGGVGKSGIGSYHGQAGFDRFSHLKPVFSQAKFNGAFLFEPPFTGWKKAALKLLRRFI